MNNDSISRNALREEVKTLFCPGSYKRMMLDCIDNAPTVHGIVAYVERPKGEWLKKDQIYECDKCGYFVFPTENWLPNFCPNCGADMRGDKE